jgi:hypothetical protein
MSGMPAAWPAADPMSLLRDGETGRGEGTGSPTLHVILYDPGEPEASGKSPNRDEAGYWRTRAHAEAIRADEAACTAAAHAHRQLAILYHRHALSIRQAGDDALQDWMSEGGSWLVDA